MLCQRTEVDRIIGKIAVGGRQTRESPAEIDRAVDGDGEAEVAESHARCRSAIECGIPIFNNGSLGPWRRGRREVPTSMRSSTGSRTVLRKSSGSFRDGT